MPAKPKPKPKVEEEPQAVDVVHIASSIKWAVGAAGALLAVLVGWYIVSDRIDSHWRLENVQVVKDKELEGKMLAEHEKTESKLRMLAQKAEVGRAWLFVAITDFKADWREQQAEDCRDRKKPNCSRIEASALQARSEAADAKRAAAAASRDP